MHKLLIGLLMVSGSVLADPPKYQTYQDQYGRTVAGSSCSGGYCAQYDSNGRTVGTSSYSQERRAPAPAPVYIPNNPFNINDPWDSSRDSLINPQR